MSDDLKKVKRLQDIAEKGQMAIFDDLDEIKGFVEPLSTLPDKIDNLSEELKKKWETEVQIEIDPEELRGAKGEKGDKGDKGDEGEKGEKGDKGDPGKDAVLPDLHPILEPFIQDGIKKIEGGLKLPGGGLGGSSGFNLHTNSVKKGRVNNLNFVEGTGVTIAHSKVNGLDRLTVSADLTDLDDTFLKLDASNDPLTGTLSWDTATTTPISIPDATSTPTTTTIHLGGGGSYTPGVGDINYVYFDMTAPPTNGRNALIYNEISYIGYVSAALGTFNVFGSNPLGTITWTIGTDQNTTLSSGPLLTLVADDTAGTSSITINQALNDGDVSIISYNGINLIRSDASAFNNFGAVFSGKTPDATPTAYFNILPAAHTASSASDYFIQQIDNSGTTRVTIPTGTAPLIGGLRLNAPNFTMTGSSTRSATLYIEGAPTKGAGAGTLGDPLALFVDGGTSRFDGNLDFSPADATNIVLGTTTGTKFGTATTQKLAFYNSTPIVQPSAYTQTYSTADKTHANLTSATLTDSTGGTANTTVQALTNPADTPADADTLRDDLVANLIPELRNNFADLTDQHNKLLADVTDLKQLVNSVIDDLQALGLVA